MNEEDKGAIDFVVEEVYGNLKKEYGDLPKKKAAAIKPRKTKQGIELEQMMERGKSREQLYQETLSKMLATKEND